MEKEQRNRLQKATQDARKLLEEEFRSQLLQTYDIDVEKVRWAEEPGAHLQAVQRLIREKLIAWIEHKEAQINDRKEALLLALREMAFTALNRFVALKLMEGRELVRPCVTGGLESAGFQEFTAVAEGLLADQEGSYRLYLETIFEDVSQEVSVLFDPSDMAAALWPRRVALLELLNNLNSPDLAELWVVDECIGWVYQYFNSKEERQEMRKSAAPRNSRELAVRNQFFTPRYVVEFLTDNTLGRIWFEMAKGETRLAEQCRYLVRRPTEIFLAEGEEAPDPPEGNIEETLSQEELLKQPVHIPHRPIKDPREIRLLDPACGSMHFGIYAFDLFESIYEEAWDNGLFPALQEAYPERADYLRDVPRLIIEHNIHGIEIDPRAAQIAGLCLWLRAQKTWNDIPTAQRPRITRSNIVCAEPMPGSEAMLEDFAGTLDPPLLGVLVKTVFDKMQLAGEAGTLLKIEEEIRTAIDNARDEARRQRGDLFEHVKATEEDFFDTAEERIYASLRDYANSAEAGDYQRRLFAEDAARGFSFTDLCRKRYDAVVMNPPFGEVTTSTREYVATRYPLSKNDIYCAFVERLLSRTELLGAITSRTALFISSFENWRREILLGDARPATLADFGSGVLDGAMVETAAYCLDHSKNDAGVFFDLISHQSKSVSLLKAIQSLGENQKRESTKIATPNAFRNIPGAPVAYWAADELGMLFSALDEFGTPPRQTAVGLQSSNDQRFLRLHWELSERCFSESCWRPFIKGGEFSRFYYDLFLTVNWKDDGKEIKQFAEQTPGTSHWSRNIRNPELYGTRGITWPLRSNRFAGQIVPDGCIFSIPGKIAIAPREELLGFLGVFNSPIFDSLLKVGAGSSEGSAYEAGLVAGTPVPQWTPDVLSTLSDAGEECWKLTASIIGRHETSTKLFGLLSDIGSQTIQEVSTTQAATRYQDGKRIAELSFKTGIEVQQLYEQSLGGIDLGNVLFDKAEEPEELVYISEGDSLDVTAKNVCSEIVGYIFGRWDIRYATGELQPPELPDPFDPLPVCPPGTFQNADGLPAAQSDVPDDYPLLITWPGILVSDPGHPEGIVARVRDALAVIWGDRAYAIEQEACEILGLPTLRDYFRRPADFFKDHLKRYSKSRRQAPIYWLLSSENGSYSVWLYYHRFTADTFYRVLRDFVEPRIQEAEREQFALESQGVLSGGAAARLQVAQELLQELRLLKNELDLVAPLWNPNLNDGVIINHAILWRITPYTPWQKKCKECWDKLVNGDYDWAHLAFHLWPERVIPKCVTDRSLAIAHGLEERLWKETNNGNWLPRQLSEADLNALIAEHSNPAVDNALERFLAAPPPVAPAKTRAKRASSASPRKSRSSAAPADPELVRQVLLTLTAAPEEGLSKNAIAELQGIEPTALTAVIKQLKTALQIEQLGAARGSSYKLTEEGRSAIDSEAAVES